MHILIVEDEEELALILQDYLRREGYRTTIVGDGLKALTEISGGDYGLVLLDLMLPGMDGLEVCKRVRETSSIPIIMLTAKAEEVDRLLGLKIGADDYVCKPYSPREVVARVEAVLRRAVTREPGKASGISGIQLLEDSLCIQYNNQQVQLTLVEFSLFKTLFRHRGKIFSRSELMDAAYSDHRVVSDRTIDSHIKKLRRKLTALIGEDILISVYGAGYKVEAPRNV